MTLATCEEVGHRRRHLSSLELLANMETENVSKHPDKNVDLEDAPEAPPRYSIGSIDKSEVFSLQSVDPALNAKMHLVNDVRDTENSNTQRRERERDADSLESVGD